jgi:TP901 family phage tail tape measure protein
MSQSGKAAASSAAKMQANLVNSINATKGFTAGMVSIESSTESFTRSLEKNKFSMGEYFRYAGASTKTFGRLFKTEFETIGKVARERVKDLQTQYIKMGRGANGALQAIKIRPTTLDLKDFGTQTAIAAQKQQLFNQLVKQGSTGLLNWGKNTQWAGRQLMVGFTIPLTIMGATAAKEFMKLEEQAIKFKRVYGDMFTTEKETKAALDNIRELANEFTKFGVAVEDTIGLAASVAQMGAMGSDLTNQVTQATRLAVLGGIDQQQALDTTISLTNAFGLATEELAGKIAFLNAAENQTILSIEDFNEAIPKAGSVVKQLGGSVEDLAYFLTAMREGGINASESANALKSSLASLVNPTTVSQQKLASFGIDILGIVDKNAGNLRATIQVLAQELEKLNPTDKARAIEQLFGKFQFARMQTLFENIIKDGGQANKILELTTNSVEELAIIAERELGKVADSPAYKFKKAIEDFKTSLAPIGEAFLKLATPLIEFGNKVLDQFNKMSDGTKQFIVGAVAIGGVVAPAVIMVIGLLANAVANTIKFGLLLKNTLTGTTQSTDILTDQLSYMNSEQVEAAAVAASLDQVHTRLKQTFTSEAAAVDALTAAYTRAITKQNQMMMAPPAGGKPPRGGKKPPGYADGVISVPGPKGAGDIVPAMLSPGEAVIPAGLAKKYAPLIDAMFKNRIPGYEGGFQPAYGGEGLTKRVAEYYRDNGIPHPAAPKAVAPSAALPKLHRAHLQAPLDPNDPEVRAQILKLAPNYDQMDPSLKANTQFSGSLVAETSPVLNQKLKSASGVNASEFGSIWDSIDDKMLGSAIAGGLDPNNPEARKALKEIEQQVGRRATELAKNAGTSVTDGILTQATDEVLAESKKAKGMQSQVASQLESRKKVIGDVRGKFTKAQYQENLASGKMALKGQQIIDPRTGIVLGDKRESRSGRNPTGYKQKTQQVSKFGGYAKQPLMATVNDPKRALLINNAAVADSKAYNQASEAEMKKSPRSDKYPQSRKRNSPHAQASKDGKADAVAYNKASTEESQKQQKASGGLRGRIASGAKGVGGKLSGLFMAPTIGTSAEDPAGEGAPNTRRGRIASGVRGLGGKLAGGGMALSSGLMMASMMGGPMGEAAGQAMGPVMALSMILPMLTSGVGAAIVALGALVAVAVLANGSFNKAQEESMKLAEALGGGSEAMKKFSLAAGKVSAGEVMDKRRENSFGVFQVQPGKDSFGNQFMGSESGEEMLGNVKNSLKTNGSEATQDMVRNQLMTAVASGAMDTAQARSIVAALAQELGDYSFGINLNAELINILGPNGENLAKDPLGIRLEILDESQDKLITSFGNLNAAAGKSFADSAAEGMGIAAGAGAGAIAGAVLGSFILPGIGTAVGAVVGTIAGGVTAAVTDIGGYIGSKISGDPSRQERIGSASGASVAMAKIALQQQQEMLDSVELEYEKRIEAAKAAGDLAEAERLATEQVAARVDLLEQNRELTQSIMDGFGEADAEVQKALMSGAEKQMASSYEGTALEDVIPLVNDLINDNVQDKEVQYLLKMQVASQEIGPLQMMNFLETFEKGSVEQDAIVNIMAKNTGAYANQVMSLVGLFEDNKSMQSDILLNINSTKTPEEAEALLEFYQRLTQTDSRISREAKFEFVMSNPEAAAELQKTLANIDNYQGKITMDVVANIAGADVVKAVNSDLEYFQSLSDEMKKIYLNTVVTSLEVITPNSTEFLNWLNGDGAGYRNRPWAEKQNAYAAYNAGLVTKTAIDMTGSTGNTDDTPAGGGGGPQGSAIDDLTKKIRDLRLETFKAQVGWDSSAKALNRLFDGGDKSLNVFTGLANKMRSLGASSGMIDLILGMDPKEFDKRKKDLFKLDPQGNIVALTKQFRSLGAAVGAIALGEYVNDQEQFISNTKDQFTAMNRLTAAGFSFVEAYEMVQNQMLATQLATAASNKEIQRLLELNAMIQKITNQKSKIDEEAQAAIAVKKTNEEFYNRYKVLSQLAKDSSGLNDDQISAILNDPNLARLYLNPQIDPKTLELRLKQAKDQANLELRLKVATEEGKEDLFDEAMGEINDQFARKEQKIEIDFRLATESDSDIVREAENRIAAIQFEIDDYQAELEGIADQEDVINDKYDKRFEALDKVGEANERIARAQKGQLDIADALSRGDIAAAAKAQADLRASEAEASVQERRALLERQKEAELANIRSASGSSRKQIEDSIKSKQDDIFKIQEDQLEPAQERIRIAEYNKAVDLDSLKIADKTRDEWDKIANAVDLATVNAEDFELAIKRAVALFEHLVNGKALDLSLFGEKELQDLVNSGQVSEEAVQDSAAQNAIAEVEKAASQARAQGDNETANKMTEGQTKIAEAARETVAKMVKSGADSLTDFERILIGAPGATMTPGEFARNALGSMMSSGGMNSLSPQEKLMLGLDGGSKDGHVTQTVSKPSVPANATGTVNTSTLAGVIAASSPTITTTAPPSSSISNANKANQTHNAGVTQAKNNMKTPTKATNTVSTKYGSLPSYIAAYLSGGGKVKGYSMGGKIARFVQGGMSLGSDTVPAMLTPGEFVIRRPAVRRIGVDNLENMNKSGTYNNGSVYNYNLAVNVSSESDPDKIARTVMKEIKRAESQRVRGSRF